MDPVRKSSLVIANQFEICLVNQRRSLQRVLSPFPSQVPGRDPMQFVVQRLYQIVESGFVARSQPFEQLGHTGRHANRVLLLTPGLLYNSDAGTEMNQDVRLLFHELADLSPGERERIFRDRQIASELRAEVESLLGFDSDNHEHLTARVSGAAEQLLESAGALQLSRCGPYRLVRLLGSGGMGAVYLAERIDGEIQQQVAVKLLGIHRPAWRDRFLKERQLLASLHHPSIVHVIDAGHTEDGRPYLAMEYVDGQPIDVYAATIDLRDRFRLFLRVCDGVAHAHHHLIIHRDLKPSNILVDASGQPKLLDFGIAKLIDQTADSTQTVERMLTPNFASPEQLRGDAQTTATDVYSLGAVLFKMLTGQSPHETKAGSQPDVPADLASILRKALRDEPEERYASVEAFGADIQAFLESRPVAARSGNAWYRTRKFVRRYWVPVAAAALVLMSLSAGLYVANRQRVLAERRFQQLRQLSSRVFDLDIAIRNLPGSAPARERLVSASLEYLEGLASEARGDLDLTREIGEGYLRVGAIQGVPNELNLGERAKAAASLEKADALMDTVLTSRPGDKIALLHSADISTDRMILAQEEHRNADAVASAHKAVGRLDSFLRQGAIGDSERDVAAGIFGNIALAHVNMHLYADAVAYTRRALELARQMSSRQYRVGEFLSILANAQRYQGDLESALQNIKEARRIADQDVFPNDSVRMLDEYGILLREGYILGEDGDVNLDQPMQAIEPLQKALDMVEQAARKDPTDSTSRGRVANSGNTLANILRHWDAPRALAVYDLALLRLREIRNSLPARRQQALVLANSAYALRSLRRAAEARQRIDAALEILKSTKDYPAERVKLDSVAYSALCALADQDAADGNLPRATETYEHLLDKVMLAQPDSFNDLREAPKLSSHYAALAALYRRAGDTAKATDMESRRVDLWRRWDSKLPNNPFVRRQLEAARRP